ncbi:hypothetical protein HYC85_026029 [Camellia sinensis]|uniref:Mediator of RNA polymerase II transcription subunit 10 n=1 Tax=Camellia sinensis TaxID=4442 RepID=A0A7J7G2E1_CAMSI|nr:hypothetical protein HYC85_026029 [Camellia sinensis]
MQYKWLESEKYSEKEHRTESKTTKKTRQIDVPSWDNDTSNGLADGKKHTHLMLVAPSWALEEAEAHRPPSISHNNNNKKLQRQHHHRQREGKGREGKGRVGLPPISPKIPHPTQSERERERENCNLQGDQRSMDSSQNSGGIINPQQNSEASTTERTGNDPKQNLNQVINSIQKTLGLIHQLYLTVSSFNVASQLPLLQRLNSLVLELDTMTKMVDKCDIQIPMEVLNLIDEGKNPDEFTRDVLNGCIAKNQITKGKTDAFKSLRKHHLEELEQAFPDEVESYREIRATSAAESKRIAQAQSILPNGDVKVKPEL